jgi:ribosomal protein S18 acetylase RimI-like enzyme
VQSLPNEQIVRPHIRVRKWLAGSHPLPDWPEGISPVLLADVDPRAAHDVLETCFPGLVAPYQDWFGNLTSDPEYDPNLCIAAVAANGSIVGLVQCWTSNFVKDLAVAPSHRRIGIGAALMRHVFVLFAERGAQHVDLKVEAGEDVARLLYQRLGMVEVA